MFKCPELRRVRSGKFASSTGEPGGVFRIIIGLNEFTVIACSGEAALADIGPEAAWDHVSVSLDNRCPTWDEMRLIKDLFWDPSDCVVQFHPAESDYVNIHPFCLHLWRPVLVTMPVPPLRCV